MKGSLNPFFLPFVMFVICFIIFFISSNCFKRRLTSWTDVPLPLAIRLRLLALMISGRFFFLPGHRLDDRFDMAELFFINLHVF